MRRPLLAVGVALAIFVVMSLRPEVASAACDPFNQYLQRGWLWAYLAAFGVGFTTSLTPCVYPMIPITLGIFGARGKDVSRGRALALATAYVVGMGITYATLGVIIALVGGQFGSILSNPYVVIPIVLLFALLAISMFGAFELNLPASWQARLNQVGGSGFRGAFAMGMVGGLIAAPCTGPFLLGMLTFVATTRDVVHGGSMLFVYALGMGVLFWVLAAFAMSLPRSGRWMEWVKSGGGILLLVGGLYFLRPLLPIMRHFAVPETWFLAVSIGIAVAGILVGAIHLSFHGSSVEKARKSLGIVLVLGGVFATWSYFLTPKQRLDYVWGDETAAFERARKEGKGVMVDFSATWCGPCEELELTFGDDDVYKTINQSFVPLKFDVSKGDSDDEERKHRYHAETLPAVVFISTEGKPVGRIDQKMEPDEMLELLRPAIAKLRSGTGMAAENCN